MTVLLWFKRDLRTRDHPALAHAARLGPVLPVYICEPQLWQQPDASARHHDFLRDCLHDLAEDLARLGLRLCLRVGDAVEVLEALRGVTGARDLVSHEETGNAWTYARDRRVAAWAAGQGVRWHEVPQSGVVRRLASRDGWAARRNAFLRAPSAEVSPGAVAAAHCTDATGDLPRLDLPDPAPRVQRGGRRRGLRALDGFLTVRGRDYRAAMASPLGGESACSRLSPHLAFGTLSGREAARAAAAAARATTDPRWAASLKSFQSRLAWRDHFMQKLEDAPRLETTCLHSAYEGLRPAPGNPAHLAAWQAGETGLPFVDACMRYLRATGWLNFRMRSMVMAVAAYHLWLDWRAPGRHLARMFTDYEPGIHWSQVQMQSGTTGMNTVRIYNPVKQGREQDPQGVFTRRWVPELAPVPDELLQEPWRWDGAAGLAYPPPVVDVAAAARAARQTVWGMRKGQAFHAEAARVIERHASRKDGAGHFVNDRTPRRNTRRQARPGGGGPRDPRQLGFDF
ncbi:MAG: deoxyribodipyrimidine photo-lyase [Rhodobacteraceae bacterium]|nr:deoxyribodipyrimidine photo-lyase [Paracoccaceae bacterium]